MKELNSLYNSPIFWIIIILLWAILVFYGQDIKDWRIKSIQEQRKKKNEPPLIVCSFCDGKGEKSTDINKLMMQAKLQLFVNHHFTVDKCNKCVKLPYGDSYQYCNTVESKYQTLLKEYAAAGPKIEKALCEKCMGMGTGSFKDLTTGKWITQEEWDKSTHEKETN